MNNVLIDSDVILDVFLDRKLHSEHSKKILELCFRKKIKRYTTSIIISNIFYIGRKYTDRRELKHALNKLLDIIEIIPVTSQSIKQALNSSFKDEEDAIQNFAALENGKITTILTGNVKDFAPSSLKVITPKNFLKTF